MRCFLELSKQLHEMIACSLHVGNKSYYWNIIQHIHMVYLFLTSLLYRRITLYFQNQSRAVHKDNSNNHIHNQIHLIQVFFHLLNLFFFPPLLVFSYFPLFILIQVLQLIMTLIRFDQTLFSSLYHFYIFYSIKNR